MRRRAQTMRRRTIPFRCARKPCAASTSPRKDTTPCQARAKRMRFSPSGRSPVAPEKPPRTRAAQSLTSHVPIPTRPASPRATTHRRSKHTPAPREMVGCSMHDGFPSAPAKPPRTRAAQSRLTSHVPIPTRPASPREFPRRRAKNSAPAYTKPPASRENHAVTIPAKASSPDPARAKLCKSAPPVPVRKIPRRRALNLTPAKSRAALRKPLRHTNPALRKTHASACPPLDS